MASTCQTQREVSLSERQDERSRHPLGVSEGGGLARMDGPSPLINAVTFGMVV